jgi:hypothetical protein
MAGMLLRRRFGEASVAPTAINSTGAINDALSLARPGRRRRAHPVRLTRIRLHESSPVPT